MIKKQNLARFGKNIWLITSLIVASLSSSVAFAKVPDSLDTLLKRAEYSNVNISPSGQYISLINRVDDRNTLIVLDRETMKPIPRKSVRYEEKTNMDVIGSQWLTDDILYYTVEFDDGKYRPYQTNDVFLLHMNKNVNERVWHWMGRSEKLMRKGGKKIQGSIRIVSVLPKDDDKILLSVSPWKRKDGGVRPTIYKMSLSTGDFSKVFPGAGRQASTISNSDGTSFFAQVPTTTILNEAYYRDVGDDSWTKVATPFSSFYPQKLSNDGKYVYALTQLDEDINASQVLIKMAVETGDYEVIHDFGFVSELSISFSAEGGELEYATWIDDKPEIKIFNTSKESSILAGFMKSFDGFNVSVTSIDDNNENIMLYVGSPGILGEYYIWEQSTKQARYIASVHEAVDQLELSSFQSVKYTASDGVKLQGWLLMPRSGKPKGLVNYIHGGPHGPLIEYRYNSRMQIMAEMGYAVFAPNFRGSGGMGSGSFGDNFTRAGFTKWGTRMLDDMREGAEFVQANYDVGERVYTMGGSYGGYSSAQNMVRHNDYYDCSVIIAGFFEFDQLKTTWDGRGMAGTSDYVNTAMGTDPVELRAQSPIHNLDKIKSPIMVIHGKVDLRTPFDGAKRFVAALKKTDVDFEYHWYNHEGHGLYFNKNSSDQFKKVNRFLNSCDARPPLNPKVASR